MVGRAIQWLSSVRQLHWMPRPSRTVLTLPCQPRRYAAQFATKDVTGNLGARPPPVGSWPHVRRTRKREFRSTRARTRLKVDCPVGRDLVPVPAEYQRRVLDLPARLAKLIVTSGKLGLESKSGGRNALSHLHLKADGDGPKLRARGTRRQS